MSDFIRPEVAAFLRRWRGILLAFGLGAVGLRLAFVSPGAISALLGWIAVVVALALVWSTAQRMRFDGASGEGPGMVEVVEGQIAYWGPQGGGFAALGEISAIALATRGADRAWVLSTPGQADLVIPLGAAGAADLFDAFGTLPGLTGAALVGAVEAGPVRPGRIPAESPAALPQVAGAAPRIRKIWTRPLVTLTGTGPDGGGVR
ncbi:MAG: hypothetical protein IT542_12960 [Rubellimicrobium sp.]|nr:hypothetical protein [Rubellimicrobium sp.]